MIVYFSPIFESCSHSQNISILHYKKGQSNRNNFTYQKKKEKTKPKNSLCNNSELPFQGSLFLPSQNHHMQDVTRKHKDTFWPKQKQSPGVDVTGDRSKIRCCKEQYCIGTWNVRSMNQGKLEVVKQEIAMVNVDILGISELKCTGMGEFNLTIISTTVGKIPLEEME